MYLLFLQHNIYYINLTPSFNKLIILKIKVSMCNIETNILLKYFKGIIKENMANL